MLRKEKKKKTKQNKNLRVEAAANASPHSKHLYSISSVWIHLWMAKGEELANLFPHLLHSKGIFPLWIKKYLVRDFPGGPVVKTPPSNAGDLGSITGN